MMRVCSIVAMGALVAAGLAVVGACGPTAGSPGAWPYKCEAPIASGQPCVFSSSCGAGLFCSVTGTCVARAAAGGPCSTTDQCDTDHACTVNVDRDGDCYVQTCDSHGACQLGAKTSHHCPISGGVQQSCPPGEGCLLVGDTKPGTCVARPKVGESCKGLDLPNPCAAGLVCGVSGVCVVPPSQGQPCGREAECAAGLVCIADPKTQASACQVPRTLGQSCNLGQCARGTHCDMKSLVCKANVGAGSACPQGNECGESPLDRGSGVSCVSQKCVQSTGVGAACEPSLAPCGAGLVCDK